MSGTSGPDYQRVADDLKSKITSGELPIGTPIPSTTNLIEIYKVSNTVVRRAVMELKNEGVVRGHPGKAVYVEKMPTEPVDDEALRAQVEDNTERIGALEAHMADLSARLGLPYPSSNATPAEAARRRRKSS
jgi:DNA-binding GntR family transcriptional regulator